MTGISPFAASTLDDIIKNNEKCEIDYPKDLWKGVSEEAKELVVMMTQRDPEKRPTAHAALCHRWFAKDFNNSVTLHSAIDNMKKYSREYELTMESERNRARFDVARIKPEFAKIKGEVPISAMLTAKGVELAHREPGTSLPSSTARSFSPFVPIEPCLTNNRRSGRAESR